MKNQAGLPPRSNNYVNGISEDLVQRLDQRVPATGSERSQAVQAILTRELVGEDSDLTEQGFDAALAPIRQCFANSGLSEEEATALLEEGLWAQKNTQRQIYLVYLL